MRILITGTTGFVGHKLKASYTDAIAAPSLRNATRDMIKKIVEESEADVVIHTAAISDIGTCQKDPQSSYFANVQIPLYLAAACKDRKLICFSSDQVYSACKEEGPYIEEVVKPGNIYAEHKLEMEERVLDLVPSAVMLRAECIAYFCAVLMATDSMKRQVFAIQKESFIRIGMIIAQS